MLVKPIDDKITLEDQYKANTNTSPILIWAQTSESITFTIKNNYNNIHFSETSLTLSYIYKQLSFLLFDRLLIKKSEMNSTNSTMTFLKEKPYLWPHLLKDPKDQDYLSSILNISIKRNSPILDTLDFDSVINGNGQKTGLE